MTPQNDQVSGMEMQSAFADAIRVQLARTKGTQGDLAQRSGKSQQAVSDRLTGRTRMTIDDLSDFAKALNLDLWELFAMARDEADRAAA